MYMLLVNFCFLFFESKVLSSNVLTPFRIWDDRCLNFQRLYWVSFGREWGFTQEEKVYLVELNGDLDGKPPITPTPPVNMAVWVLPCDGFVKLGVDGKSSLLFDYAIEALTRKKNLCWPTRVANINNLFIADPMEGFVP
ncbi:hypothetical protein VNO77_18115 [Canavalia gladiata]|uniref:Uncharacterized protein n=1 Tax=Canavalia gladiata TaxID=3824 RepID=A0AAN9QHB8_CANGL